MEELCERHHTLHGELDDSSVFTKGVDGMAGEEARVLSNGWHDLVNNQDKNLGIL